MEGEKSNYLEENKSNYFRSNKSKYLLLLPVLVAFVFVLAIGVVQFPSSGGDVSDGINYYATVCVYVNGVEHECNSNVLFQSGQNLTRDALGVNAAGSILNISLCNSTAPGDCGTPSAAGTESFNAYTSVGLVSVEGTYFSNSQNGNWTISNTFTSSSAATLNTNVTRLGNLSGTQFAGNSFTAVSLENNDKLTINWTIDVS